jgi:hypothetical protein
MTKSRQNMWTMLKRRLIAWQDNEHFEMRNLNDRTVRDIGLTRANGRLGPPESFLTGLF